jgi:hypothetical protein
MNTRSVGCGRECACRVDGANREPVKARMQQHCPTEERSRVRRTSNMAVANAHKETFKEEGKEVCTVGAMQLAACGNLT